MTWLLTLVALFAGFALTFVLAYTRHQTPTIAPRRDDSPELALPDTLGVSGPSCEHDWLDDTDPCDPTRAWVCLHCGTEYRAPRREDVR